MSTGSRQVPRWARKRERVPPVTRLLSASWATSTPPMWSRLRRFLHVTNMLRKYQEMAVTTSGISAPCPCVTAAADGVAHTSVAHTDAKRAGLADRGRW